MNNLLTKEELAKIELAHEKNELYEESAGRDKNDRRKSQQHRIQLLSHIKALDALKPVWTEITRYKDSWPELDPEYGIDEIEVIARFPDASGKLGSIEAFVWDEQVCIDIMQGDMLGYIGGKYRLAGDLDTP